MRCSGYTIVLSAIFHDGRKPSNLGLGLEHCLVGAIEVVEMAHQCVDAIFDWERLKHVLTDEVGQVADGFHGHSLVE